MFHVSRNIVMSRIPFLGVSAILIFIRLKFHLKLWSHEV